MTRSQPKLETRILESIRKDPVNVYAVTLHQRFYDEDGRDYWLASIQGALRELETDGTLRSEWGEATPERGGRRKRLYFLAEKADV